MNKFAQACIDSYNDWEKSLPDIETAPDPVYSKKHIRKMEKLFDKMRGNTYHILTKRAIRTILVAALISALLLCAFKVPSSREFTFKQRDKYTRFTLSTNNTKAVIYMDVDYLPEGYRLSLADESSTGYFRTYSSPDGKIVAISKDPPNSTIRFDTEGGSVTEVTIGNITYFVLTNFNNHTGIIWTVNDYIYLVSGPISQDELFKIAQNVE